MPRVHPSKLPPVDVPELLDLDDITVKTNSNASSKQASESFAVKSTGGDALGEGGETRGFAKKSVVVPHDYTANSDKRTDEFAMNTGFMYKNLDMIDDATLGGDRALLTRAVASYEADKLLGLNTLSQEKFAVGSDGTVMGVSIQADGAAVIGNDGRLDVDYRDPKIQRGLSDLEVSDYITGQTDRHMGNIFIDPKTGKVTGIDNDLAFPEQDRAEVLKVDHGLRTKMAGTMPRMMHKETAEKILKADPEELRTTLSKPPPHGGPSPLSKEEIDGAVNRLKELQSELGKGKKSSIKVVSKFDNGTYNAAVKEQENMLKRTEKGKGYKDFHKDAMGGNTFASKTVLATRKTSYIGGVDLAIRVQKMEKPELQKVVKVGPKAERVAEMQPKVAYESLSPKEQKAFDKEFAKLQKMDTQLEKRQQNLQKMESERPEKPGFGQWNANRKIEAEKRAIGKLENQIDKVETRLPVKTTNSKGLEMEDELEPSLKRGESRSMKGTSKGMKMDEMVIEEIEDLDLANNKPKLSKDKEIEDGTIVENAPREVQVKTRDVMSELQSKIKTKQEKTLQVGEGTSNGTSTRDSYTPKEKPTVKQGEKVTKLGNL